MNNTILKCIPASFMIFAFVVLGLVINPSYAYAQETHTLFTDILRIYVEDGKVDYKNLKQDFRFGKYLEQIKTTNPNKIKNDADRMAFWINAYNAYTLKVIIDNYPLKSINELHRGGLVLGTLLKSTIWDAKIFEINKEMVSLSYIENEILRKEFNEPRIHFAIVCASKSCPPLRSEAYEGYKLDAQLTDQAKTFLSQKDKNFFEFKKNEAFLSPIFKWFKKDFGANNQEVLIYLSQFLDSKRARELTEYVDTWKIKYTAYDWNLNEW